MTKSVHDTGETEVIFRKEGNDVVAFFPTIPGSSANNISCYAHVGQHSCADIAYAAACTPANADEYAALKSELESAPYGYKLTIVHRFTSAHRNARLRVIADMNAKACQMQHGSSAGREP